MTGINPVAFRQPSRSVAASQKLEVCRAAGTSARDPVALSAPMVEAMYRAHVFAPAASPIVLYGETGTGKTYFAEYIHQLSGRSGGFHALALSTVPPQLAADALFGHVAGAFTDARKIRPGIIATAGEGTLLLDEMHTLELGVQKQLLQVFDRGIYRPVGSDRLQTAPPESSLLPKHWTRIPT